ncbi:hypothetical protein Tco_0530673 [Tanacetum coccineum]
MQFQRESQTTPGWTTLTGSNIGSNAKSVTAAMAGNWYRYRIRKPEPKTESFLSRLFVASISRLWFEFSGSVAYFPCLRNGIPKGAAILIAFFMSAAFHEVAGKALFMAHVEGQLKVYNVHGIYPLAQTILDVPFDKYLKTIFTMKQLKLPTILCVCMSQ